MRLELRRPWRDGTTDLVFDPIEFLGRLAVLVPRPRINLLLYHGVLGPRAAWRAEVVRRGPADDGAAELAATATELGGESDPAETAPTPRPARAPPPGPDMPNRIGWDDETSVCTSAI